MTSIRNRVQLMGYVGTDPGVHEYQEGKKLVKLNLATHEYYTDAKGEKQSVTHWHVIIFWDDLAEEVADQLRKGMHVLIEGKLIHNQFTDQQGQKRHSIEVRGNSFYVLAP